MLREIGWRAETIEGGYKSFRRLVVRGLYNEPLPHKLVLLSGYTGTAKTELLPRLAALGLQVIDLEGLANHRGSLLGERDGPQPSQKAFETSLAMALARCSVDRPVLLEAESSKIGRRTLPPSLWSAMCDAPIIEVAAPLQERSKYLAKAYSDILSDKARLLEKLDILRRHRGHKTVDGWHALANAQDDVALCRALASEHYDPAYDSAHKDQGLRVQACIEAKALTNEALDEAATRIRDAVHATTN
jgi:tRNA 2-selenouridine synthase